MSVSAQVRRIEQSRLAAKALKGRRRTPIQEAVKQGNEARGVFLGPSGGGSAGNGGHGYGVEVYGGPYGS